MYRGNINSPVAFSFVDLPPGRRAAGFRVSGGIMLSKHHWAVTVAGNSVARSAATYWTLKRGRNNERMKVKIHLVNFFF